ISGWFTDMSVSAPPTGAGRVRLTLIVIGLPPVTLPDEVILSSIDEAPADGGVAAIGKRTIARRASVIRVRPGRNIRVNTTQPPMTKRASGLPRLRAAKGKPALLCFCRDRRTIANW